MANKIDSNTSAVAYHINDGEHTFPYSIDAHSAVSRFPKEWSFTPWAKDGEPTKPVIEIPEDLQDLKPTQRINLAISLTGADRKGLTAAKADEIIAAEVESRASEPAKPSADELAQQKKAADDKLAKDKAEQDRIAAASKSA